MKFFMSDPKVLRRRVVFEWLAEHRNPDNKGSERKESDDRVEDINLLFFCFSSTLVQVKDKGIKLTRQIIREGVLIDRV